MRVHLQLDAPPDQAADRARWLAATGVDGLFTFEGQHDVFVPLTVAAMATDLPLMTNVAVALPRSPLHLAHVAYDLHLLTQGKFTLGLGSQVRTHIERRYGAAWSRPAARMRESVAATREILAAWQEQRPPAFRGEFTRHDFMPPMFAPPPLPWGAPPVMLGALGPLMTQVAGEVADGLLVMPFNTRRHILERTLPALQAGLDRAGRRREDVTLVPQVIAAMGENDEEVAASLVGASSLVAFYASTPAYRPVLEVAGHEELQPRLQELVRTGDNDAMRAALPDAVLDEVIVRGTPTECARQIADKFAGISDQACVYFPGSRPTQDTIAHLVEALHTSTSSPPALGGS